MIAERRQRDLLAAALLAALVLLFWNPLLRPGRIYPSGDLTNLFWPQRVHLARSFAEGTVPLWNRFTWGGSPFLASMQPGVFDLLSWPFFVGARDELALLVAFNRQRLLMLVILGLNALALGRCGFGLSRSCAVFAALTLSCCGFLWGHFDHVNQLSALAWAPLVLLGALRVAAGARRGVPVIAVGVALQSFAGHPQHVALGAVAAAVLVGAGLLAAGCGPRSMARTASLVLLGYVAGALIAAIQWLPALELARASERIFDPPEFATSFSMRPVHLARLVWPQAFGQFPRYTTDENFSELGLFVGRVPLALALAAVAAGLAGWRRWPRGTSAPLSVTLPPGAMIAALCALALVATLWSLGSNGPLLRPLLAVCPPLRSFRVPPRMLFHLDLALVFLAAMGLEALRPLIRGASGGSARTRVCTGVVIALTLVDLWAASRSDYFRRPTPAAIAASVSAAAAPMVRRDEAPRLYRLALNDTDFYIDPRPPALTRRLLRLQPNLGLLWGITDIEGYTEGLLPTARWRDLLGLLYRNLHQSRLDAHALALLGVRWVMTESSATPIEPNPLRLVLEFTDPEDVPSRTYALYENPLALPPVVPRHAIESLATPENLDGLWTRGLRDAPLRLGQPVSVARPAARWPHPGELPALPLRWESANRAVVDNPSGFTGEAVLIQAVCGGWVAEDDQGNRQPLRPLNAVWSAWDIAPGVRWSSLSYEPATYRLGLFLSAVTAMIVCPGWLCLSWGGARRGVGTEGGHRAPGPAPAARCDTGTR